MIFYCEESMMEPLAKGRPYCVCVCGGGVKETQESKGVGVSIWSQPCKGLQTGDQK